MNSLLNQETIKLTELLMPWITILISLIVALWLKDFAIDNNKIKPKFFRITNEIPAFFLNFQEL